MLAELAASEEGREQPDFPSCSLRPHDQNVLPQCEQGRKVWLFPLGQSGENPKIFARANGTFREIECEAIGGSRVKNICQREGG